MSARKYKTAREVYLARLVREDIARAADNAELKACEQIMELVEWRNLAGVAINTAEKSGRNVDWLRSWQDELNSARTHEQWRELEETLGF